MAKVEVVAAFLIICLTAFACNNREAEKMEREASLQPKVIKVERQNNLTSSEELPREQVCMVNNAFLGKKQILVAYENKTYYGCCEMYIDKIKTNKAVRYATDPHTGKEIDKATAFIVLNLASPDGSVIYFESEKSFIMYKANLQVN